MTRAIEQPLNARSRRSRAALLDATLQLITEGGFDALTMAAVAERAGVSRRSVYLHFATRAELVSGIFGRLAETEEVGTSLKRVWDSPNSVSALGEWGRHLARIHLRILPVLQAVERARHVDADAAELWRNHQQRWLNGARRLANWLDEEGRLAQPLSPASAADMIWSLMSVDLLDRLLNQRGWSAKRIGEHLAVLFTSAFATDDRGPDGLPSDRRSRPDRGSAPLHARR
jgi:AcrR family transcriptional regulator